MEFFLPSLVILILAGIVSFVVIPRMGPLVVLVLSIALLTFGMYHHYKLFSAEYRQSTWQEQLRFYAPGIAIGGLVLFIMIYITSLFRGGEVPVPEMPSITPVSNSNTITSPVASILNTLKNTAENVMDTATSTINTIKNTTNKVANTISENINTTINTSVNSKNIRTSFFNKI
jgi:hypothetical protein